MHVRPRLRYLAVLGLAGLALAAVGVTAAQSKPLHSTASTIIDGTTDTVTNVDPAGNYDYGSATVDLLVYEHLFDYPLGHKAPTPSLATGCTANAAQTAWTCALRKGVKFSNGDPFTSADVKWSFDRVNAIKDPSGIYGLISNLKDVTTNGDYSVTFNLKTPQSTWPFILTTGAATIVDHKVYPADKIVANTDTKNLVGTGPYVLSKFTPGQQAVFTPNPNYDGSLGSVKNGGVIINYYSKSSTMKLALQQGTIDMAFRDFTPTEYAALGTTSGITVFKGSGVVIRYLVLNVKRAPTNNLAVRKAMVPAGLPGHVNAFGELYGTAPSTAKAKAVLKAGHVKTPVKLTVWWTPSHYGDASADEYTEIQRALNSSKLFKVTLKSAEWATYSKTLGTQYGAFQLGWFPDYVDAEDYLVPFYASGSNFTSNGYKSAKMDALLHQEQGAKSTAQRLSIVKQAQMVAAKDAPIIPYWQGAMLAVGRSDIHGIQGTLDPTYLMRFWEITKS